MKVLAYSVLVLFLLTGVFLVASGVSKHIHPTKTTANYVEGIEAPANALPAIPNLKTKRVLSVQVPDEQVIVLLGEIGENAANVVTEIVTKSANKKPIWLLINSPGGSVLDGALIISAMEAAGVPVNTVCLQLCASMAAIIHQHGTKRYMLDRSLLMFHDAAGGFQGDMRHVQAQFDAVNLYVTKFNYYIAKRAGKDPLRWIQQVNHNLWIDGEDSVTQHFADSLVFVKVYNTRGIVDMNSLITIPKPALPVRKAVNVPNDPFQGLIL